MKRAVIVFFVSLMCTVAVADEAAVRRAVRPLFGDKPVESIARTPVLGLYEVVVDKKVYYVDEAAQYMLDGEVIDLKAKKNLTQERVRALLKISPSELPLELAIKRIRGNGERTVVTFEDPNCGYCKRMAKDTKNLANVTLYTFLYPILSSDSVQKAKTIWCSDDRAKTWAAWMEDDVPPSGSNSCPNPIDQILELGKKQRVTGTPTLIFNDGSRIPGAISLTKLEDKIVEVEGGPRQSPAVASNRKSGSAQLTGSTGNAKAGSGSPTAACQPTMAFMENRIPNFSAPELRQIRQAILAEDVRVAMSKAKAQGFTTQGAIKAALDQAKEFDRVSRESAQCAADVDALGATDESFLASMRQGRAPTTCSGIRNSCLCAGVLNRMSAVGSRALAAEMQCFARSGQPDATVADEQAVRQATEEERQRRAAMPVKPVTTPASNQATCPAGLVRLPWGCRDPNENPFGDPNRR